MNLKQSLNKGFTLVELLITVVIIGILASILLPKFSNNSDKARDTASLASLKSLDTAADVFIVDASTAEQTLINDWASVSGYMNAADREEMVGDLADAGKVVLSGTPAQEAAKFRAYALVSGGKVSNVTIMQYRGEGAPHVVNANKTVSSDFAADTVLAANPADFETISIKADGTTVGSDVWPY